mgnify:CR=1 FL=1
MESSSQKRTRVLDPIERSSEILFGLIMVLTFTSSLSAGDVGRDDVRTMLVGAIGCNLAWGLVDAVMYIMSSLSQRGRGLVIVQAVRRGDDAAASRGIIADSLPPLVASALGENELERIRLRLRELPEPPAKASVRGEDFLGAMAVFLVVFLSTFPVVVPFIFMSDPRTALRVSNGIAIVMLFVAGQSLARHAGGHPWRTGLAMVAVGVVLVGITIALGG